jgi:hypothetical protein
MEKRIVFKRDRKKVAVLFGLSKKAGTFWTTRGDFCKDLDG